MHFSQLLNYFPLWVTYLVIVIIIVLSVWSGLGFARWRKKRFGEEDDTPVNTVVGATLGLLAFILAFTFGLTSSRFDARKTYLMEEVNSIETSWLRAGLVGEPHQSILKKSLVDYVKVRIDLAENPGKVIEAIQRSQQIQGQIWAQVTELANEEAGNDWINALLISSINDMFDNQSRRITVGLIDHVPGLMWLALFTLVIISMMGVGYLLGKMQSNNGLLILGLSLAFSAILIIIIDLDSSRGTIKVNNQAMTDLYERLTSN